jgi:hypothetical protein
VSTIQLSILSVSKASATCYRQNKKRQKIYQVSLQRYNILSEVQCSSSKTNSVLSNIIQTNLIPKPLSLLYKDTPQWFIPTIQRIVQQQIPTPLNVSLRFELNDASAVHNMNELRKHGNDLHTYIISNKHSFMGYGSEFRPQYFLEELLLHHRSWPSLLSQLTKGSSWPLSPISEKDRKAKNLEFIARGNHKSAVTS